MDEELPIITKLYQVIVWTVPLLSKLPRDHRFLLGDRIAGGLYDLLGTLVRARYRKEKRALLAEASERLSVLRLQVRPDARSARNTRHRRSPGE